MSDLPDPSRSGDDARDTCADRAFDTVVDRAHRSFDVALGLGIGCALTLPALLPWFYVYAAPFIALGVVALTARRKPAMAAAILVGCIVVLAAYQVLR